MATPSETGRVLQELRLRRRSAERARRPGPVGPSELPPIADDACRAAASVVEAGLRSISARQSPSKSSGTVKKPSRSRAASLPPIARLVATAFIRRFYVAMTNAPPMRVSSSAQSRQLRSGGMDIDLAHRFALLKRGLSQISLWSKIQRDQARSGRRWLVVVARRQTHFAEISGGTGSRRPRAARRSEVAHMRATTTARLESVGPTPQSAVARPAILATFSQCCLDMRHDDRVEGRSPSSIAGPLVLPRCAGARVAAKPARSPPPPQVRGTCRWLHPTPPPPKPTASPTDEPLR